MTVGAIDSPPFEASPRVRILRAVAFHVATLLVAFAATATLATIYLLARTDRGAVDAADSDANVAVAILTAAVPAWTAYQWRRGAHIVTPRSVLRAALYPANLPAWLWLAATVALLPPLAIPALVVSGIALAVAVLAFASLLLLLLRPHSAPLHDRVSRIRLRGHS